MRAQLMIMAIPEISHVVNIRILRYLSHFENEITLIANAINWDGSPDRVDDAYRSALARIDGMVEFNIPIIG
jgi:anthranilate synthase component 1